MVGGESGDRCEWVSQSAVALRARSGAVRGFRARHARTRTRPRARLIAAIHYGEQSSDRRVSHLVMANLTNPLLLPALAVMPQCAGLWETTDSMGTVSESDLLHFTFHAPESLETYYILLGETHAGFSCQLLSPRTSACGFALLPLLTPTLTAPYHHFGST